MSPNFTVTQMHIFDELLQQKTERNDDVMSAQNDAVERWK
jgi:hypothetical protein